MRVLLGNVPAVVENFTMVPPCQALQHFDYIEIGTSSFDTLVQHKRYRSLRGLSVDPMLVHLRALPDRPLNTKVRVAIGPEPGYNSVYYVHPQDIIKYKLPHYLRGCNMVGSPHPIGLHALRKGLEHLMRRDEIRIVTLPELFRAFCVGTVGYFKVDTEGFDTFIMESLLEALARRAIPPPTRVLYESNWLDPARQQAMQEINRRMVVEHRYTYTWDRSSRGGKGLLQPVGGPTKASIARYCQRVKGSAKVHCWNHEFRAAEQDGRKRHAPSLAPAES